MDLNWLAGQGVHFEAPSLAAMYPAGWSCWRNRTNHTRTRGVTIGLAEAGVVVPRQALFTLILADFRGELQCEG